MQIPYSGKLLREKTFANFAVLWLFAKFMKYRGVVPLARQKWAIHESFLCENCIFHQFAKVLSFKSFPLCGKLSMSQKIQVVVYNSLKLFIIQLICLHATVFFLFPCHTIWHVMGVIARALGLRESMHSNGKLLGPLCGRDKWIINILLHSSCSNYFCGGKCKAIHKN